MNLRLIGDFERLSGDEARRYFDVYMKNTIDSMKKDPNVVKNLEFIKKVFHDMASDDEYVTIGTRQVYRQHLGSEEIKSLCKFSQKFFKNNKDLEVGKELLGDLTKVEEKVIGEPQQTIDFHNKRRLSVVRDLIFLNEKPEFAEGPRKDLQKNLREEIKLKAVSLQKMRRATKIKRAAVLTGVAAVSVGAIVGMLATGGTLALILFPWAAFTINIILVSSGFFITGDRLNSANDVQRRRVLALELLQDEDKFKKFCAFYALAPENVTVDHLLLASGVPRDELRVPTKFEALHNAAVKAEEFIASSDYQRTADYYHKGQPEKIKEMWMLRYYFIAPQNQTVGNYHLFKRFLDLRNELIIDPSSSQKDQKIKLMEDDYRSAIEKFKDNLTEFQSRERADKNAVETNNEDYPEYAYLKYRQGKDPENFDTHSLARLEELEKQLRLSE